MDLTEALTCLARHGPSLRGRHRFSWGRQVSEAVDALRFTRSTDRLAAGAAASPRGGALTLVGVVGGASSGKSTVFNNLLGGRPVSCVTAKAHATRGPIAAVHAARRDDVERLFDERLLLPSFARRTISLDDRAAGEPDALCVAYHGVDALRDVILIDTPDCTSEPARQEGDVALAMLPWFDRVIVLVDHERWFDRLTMNLTRDESARFGQARTIAFNRVRSEGLTDTARARLARQAERMGADDHLVLDFRRGRGLCVFAPGTLSPIYASLSGPRPDRANALTRFLGLAAGTVVGQNLERAARLKTLRAAVDRAAQGTAPSRFDCMTALMTEAERQRLAVVWRALRWTDTRQWLQDQADRVRRAIRRHVPLVGTLLASEPDARPAGAPAQDDRFAVAWQVFRARAERVLGAIRDAADNSEFWEEVRRWGGAGPPAPDADDVDSHRERVRAVAMRFDAAAAAWTERVRSECAGVTPHVVGAVGATTLAGAIVLAATGPIGALTLPAAKAAIFGAVGTLAASAGVGAAAGRPIHRLVSVIHERLLGSEEYRAVQAAADAFREALTDLGRSAADEACRAGAELVLPEDGPLVQSLNVLCDAGESA